jgi:hypothetical protein
MKKGPMNRRASALALFLGLLLGPGPARPLRALDLQDFGLEGRVEELIRLEKLNRSVRFDAEEAIRAEWSGDYDRISLVDIAEMRTRYGLFESDAERRCDIAIRGTVNLRNALLDLQLTKRRSESLGINLHGGFEKAAFALFEDLRPRLPRGYSIRVTGHSLGAAEAIILGMILSQEGYPLERVLASAPPKVTDEEGWASFPDLPLMRVVGAFDPVPFLPPRRLMYGRDPYVQGGAALLLLDGTRFSLLESAYFDDLPAALRQAGSEGLRFEAADHLLPIYLERLLPKAEGLEFVDPAEWEDFATPAKR